MFPQLKIINPVSWVLFIGSLFIVQPVQARHAGGHPVHYVSNHGVDEGACESPQKPCKTIKYAIDQSGKGDKIHLAEGDYRVEGSDIFYLLSDMVLISGGYDPAKNFQHRATTPAQTAKPLITSIIGVPAEYRDQLAKRGLHLIRDRKGESTLDMETAKQLKLYQKLIAKGQPATRCNNGMAGNFPCDDFDLQSNIPLSSFSSKPSSANDIWGFLDLNDNNEYAIIGLNNGTAVVNVTDPQNPVEVGIISGNSSIWRDMKVYQYFDTTTQKYKAYAYVTTEANQGMQVIDLTDLPNSISLANTINDFSTAHNVYIANVDYSTGLNNEPLPAQIYIAGANVTGGAFRVLDLSDPVNPVLQITPPTNAGYMHDVSSMIITDNRTSQCADGHNPCEILLDYNETTVDIWDITDPSQPLKLSSTGYANSGYTHSGWWSSDKRYIFVQDELDEQRFGLNTTLRVMDINDLSQPTLVATYTGPTAAIDHNGFVLGNRYYMSTYRRGLTVLDISDPTHPQDLGFFDTFPTPSANSANFNGAWGVYPFLPSGNILVSDIEFGLFIISEKASGATIGLTSGGNSGSGNNGNNNDQVASATPSGSSGGGALLWVLIILPFMRILRGLQPRNQAFFNKL